MLAALEREKADNYEALFAQACIHGLRGRGKNVRLPGVSMMTSEELAAIKARAEAATPGPWEVGECNEVRAACPVVGFDRGTADEMYVRHQECTYPNCEPIGMGDAPRGYRVFICETDSGAYGPLREDAEFIAHARTDVPALLAEVERLRNEPPLAYHAISELNAAHKLLDHLGAPKTKTVHAREGSGTQEITLGISERIIAMK